MRVLSVTLALILRNMNHFLEEGKISLFTHILKSILDSAKVKQTSVNDTPILSPHIKQ